MIIATGNVFIEKKFLRGLGSVGHIEDIAVDKTQQGKKLGLRVIQTLTEISEVLGCYKTILNCSDANIRELSRSRARRFLALHSFSDVYVVCASSAFYEKCGFVKKENEMVMCCLLRFLAYLLILEFCRPSMLLVNVLKLQCLLVFEGSVVQ
jgi:glucosamine-phosphate N-acetyltransferase